MDLQNFDKIKLSAAANIGAGVFGLVVPGFLMIFVWAPSLFERLDFWKLLILSLSACLPTFLLPFGVSGIFHRLLCHDKPGEVALWGTPVDWYLRHAFNNSLNMYTIILIGWLLDFTVLGVVWSLVFCGLLMTAVECVHLLMFKKRPSALYNIWFILDSGGKNEAKNKTDLAS